MTDERYDGAVIGGGIVGLATARELLLRRPGWRVALIEKEPSLACHQSGRNSGVVHSGAFYRPGSLKAQLCLEGRRLLLRFCDEHSVPYERCGKLVIAATEEELPALEDLRVRGAANGVEGIDRLSPEALRDREPHAIGRAALWIPSAAIVDFPAVAAALAEEVRALGGEIQLDREVRHLSPEPGSVRVETSRGTLRAGGLIVCAGLQSDRLANSRDRIAAPRILPFRGDYYTLRPEARPLVRGLIYPAPRAHLPFLGIHLTRRIDGAVWAGPNAVLSLAREGYRRGAVVPRDAAETFAWPGFWRLARRHWREGAAELWRDWVKGAYAAALRSYVPEIRAAHLEPGPCGIRAQAIDRSGGFLDDFAFHAAGRALHVLNAPSPAATSALAIAREIVDRAVDGWGEKGAPRERLH